MSNVNESGLSQKGIQVYGLSKNYGEFRALDDISLQVNPGEFLTLLGPSGSGKSTLLMAIAGFVEPSHGNILVAGKSIVRLAPEQRDFGVVFQGYALFPHMTIADNIAYPLKMRGLDSKAIQAKTQEMLALVQLDHLASRYPKQLSGGQQQRVALARALVFLPKVLLLDEPMGALDKKLRHDLQIELRQLHKRLGCTFINVTHDQEEAMAMSDRIAIMRAGKIVQLDTPNDLYNKPASQFVADFLGKSNFVSGKVVGVAGDIVTIDTEDGPVTHQYAGAAPVIGTTLMLAIRPNRVKVGEVQNRRTAVVKNSTFFGDHAEVVAQCASGLTFSMTFDIVGDNTLPVEGSQIDVGWVSSASVAVAPDCP